MRFQVTVHWLLVTLLTACASNPPQPGAQHSKAEVEQKLQQMQQQRQASISPAAITAAQPEKSIVPDINEQGHRGEIARQMLAKTSARFLQADVNRDYLVSSQEATEHMPHVSREFSRYDKDGDGNISWQELLGHDKWPRPEHGKSNP